MSCMQFRAYLMKRVFLLLHTVSHLVRRWRKVWGCSPGESWVVIKNIWLVCISHLLRHLQSQAFQLLLLIRSSLWGFEVGLKSFVMHLTPLVSSDMHVLWMISCLPPSSFSLEKPAPDRSCVEEMEEKRLDLSKEHTWYVLCACFTVGCCVCLLPLFILYYICVCLQMIKTASSWVQWGVFV